MSRKVPLTKIRDGQTYTLVCLDDEGEEKRFAVKADVRIERHVTFEPLDDDLGVLLPGPMRVSQWIEETE